jgi:hypothetical protein
MPLAIEAPQVTCKVYDELVNEWGWDPADSDVQVLEQNSTSLASMANILAARQGTTFTAFSRADALQVQALIAAVEIKPPLEATKLLDLEAFYDGDPNTVAEWLERYRPMPRLGPAWPDGGEE